MVGSEENSSRKNSESAFAKVAKWFDSRLGLSYPLLRPAPQYAINPFYWLGALAVVAYIIQGITGVIMMLYYVPSPSQAYSSTRYIFQNVNFGSFFESVHLYTAYAMIVLAFMHMMRGYFVSVHKKPREAMWLIGMMMGFVTLGFGFTGYLLPWTVVSKSATDVGVGMIDALPAQIGSFLKFLIVGAGGDATELLRFYDLHVVVLPTVMLALLVVKMYMLEAHGISERVTGKTGSAKESKLIPIFPDVTLYLLQLGAAFGAGMLLISALFPLELPPQYTPQAAASYTPQPDWYFLWIYQILKIEIFEGAGLPIALSIVTVIIIVIFLLPFIDRGETRRIGQRPIYITLGVIFVAELVVLAVWGLLTPGQVIPNEQGALIFGGTAILIALVSFAIYKLFYTKMGRHLSTRKMGIPPSTGVWTISSLVTLIVGGSLAIGKAIETITQIVVNGVTPTRLISTGASFVMLSLVVLGTLFLLYRLDWATGMIKRRIRRFEFGWDKN